MLTPAFWVKLVCTYTGLSKSNQGCFSIPFFVANILPKIKVMVDLEFTTCEVLTISLSNYKSGPGMNELLLDLNRVLLIFGAY